MTVSIDLQPPMESEAPTGDIKLVPCGICGRGFTKDRIKKHNSICAKQKPRKVYDITQKRVAGTDAGELVKAGKILYCIVHFKGYPDL